ncbi:BREX-1 system adenine-specific DNA-methyltransferase PglX [Heyndrickxia coagulans]|uniref:BREX-1 system adenine-specific DNA-methyltransferase PglX n=1 Tax=Heyndrickxia coagulans TaxID=1398 RepID=UPI002164BE70|nr:BREX-1 system adenine-specific DNA-methyltransferase PglX [Heyndrickxia coagulans]
MNKTELKKFAVEARRDLLEKVALKAEQYGITKENPELTIEENYGQLIVNGKTFPTDLKHALRTLQNRLNTVGYGQLIEEVAYTWFNRIIAIRYMEVNNYLPDRVNVLSSSSGKNEPDILLQYETMNLNVDNKQINDWIQKGDNEQAYRKLFIAQCNNLNKALPSLFEKINDYTELLLPDYLLDSEFVISKLVNNEELTVSFEDVEVIGWLYQYYNSELKEEVNVKVKKNQKVTKEDIPAATQLFTPKWIVKYMVENSLGLLWLESFPESILLEKMNYFVDTVKQEASVLEELEKIRYKNINLEEITVIDPCVGSGHMLVYAFDLLFEMYLESGYLRKDIPKLILENNLIGLDIDERATQLATFALVMKAREKSRSALKMDLKPRITTIKESNSLDLQIIKQKLCQSEEDELKLERIIERFYDAKNFGSLIRVDDLDYKTFIDKVNVVKGSNDIQLTLETYYFYDQLKIFEAILEQAKILGQTYDITITNPPYMGSGNINPQLKKFLNNKYPDAKSDLFSSMMERMEDFTKNNGFIANVTMQSWMFLSSFEKFRRKLLSKYSIYNMVHMESMVMGIAFGTVATVYRNLTENYKGVYQFVRYKDIINNEPYEFPIYNERYSIASSESFKTFPGSPVSYWASEQVKKIYKTGKKINDVAIPKVGLQTGDNERFLKLWYEVDFNRIGFGIRSRVEAKQSKKKWFPHNKGGEFRKWYGNFYYVVDWENDGIEIRNNVGNNGKLRSRPQNTEYYFKEGITWSDVTSGSFSGRYTPVGSIFDTSGPTIFPNNYEEIEVLLAYLNSKVFSYLASLIMTTFHFNSGVVGNQPYLHPIHNIDKIKGYVDTNIKISKESWDSFEISFDFQKHPFLNFETSVLKDVFDNWKEDREKKIKQLKSNEEEINKIFIELYSLQNELSPAVTNSEIKIRKAEIETDTKSFLSYFIGCLMGRYSLDIEGLAYAGGEFDESKYKTFKPNPNGLILLTDDHYFENDIIVRLREFLSVAFSPDTVDENLRWLAESLEMKKNESPEERLRRFFLDEFFKEHCKTYQKRPIYWLVDSGKQKGLRTLIYMHRYQPDTMATIRFDHLQEIQAKYQNEIEMIDTRLANPSLSATDRRNLEKDKISYQKKIEELQEFDKHLAVYANEPIEIDLDDGVKVNYAKFDKVLAKIK